MAEREETDFLDLFNMDVGVPTEKPEGSEEPEDVTNPEDTTKDILSSEELDVNTLFENQKDGEDDDKKSEESKSEEKDDPNPEKSDEDKQDQGEPPALDSSSKKKTDDTQDSPTLLFARFLSEQGNLTSFNEESFLKDVEENGEDVALGNLWNAEAEKIKSELLDSYEEDVKEYLSAIDSGVDPKQAKSLVNTKKYFESVDKASLEDDDKEDLRRQILTHRYQLTTNFKDDKIKKLVDRAVSLGEDVEEATEAIDEMVTYYEEAIKNEKKLSVEAETKAREKAKQDLDDFKKRVIDLKEVVPGMTLTGQEKQRVIDKLTKPKEEKNGRVLNEIWSKREKDPFKFDTTIAVLDELGVFDGKWDKLMTKTRTQTLNQLKKKLESDSSFKTRVGVNRDPAEDITSDNLSSMKNSIPL